MQIGSCFKQNISISIVCLDVLIKFLGLPLANHQSSNSINRMSIDFSVYQDQSKSQEHNKIICSFCMFHQKFINMEYKKSRGIDVSVSLLDDPEKMKSYGIR